MQGEEMEERRLEAEMLAHTEGEGRSWWSGFQPRHLKLRLIKAAVNYTAPRVRRLAPERTPALRVTRIVDGAFRRLLKVLEREERGNSSLGDRHFRNLVEAARRALIYVAEEDCYYQDWLALLVMALYGEVKAEVDAWDPSSEPWAGRLRNAGEIVVKPGGRELLFYWSLRHTLPITREGS